MTKRKTTLLDKAYASFIDMVLSDVPLDNLDKVVAHDVMGFGTTVDEKIHDLKGLRDLAILQREQSADMKINYEISPVFRKIMNQATTAIIVDEIKMTIQDKEEKMELWIRLSTILYFIDGNWKVVHWHGSKPEYDSGGSDPWHKEEWQKKNEELQKLVEEKTTDLIIKNRELEIESSLERVRAVAMSMQKPDDLLDLCEIISDQLGLLNVSDIRNIQVAIVDEANKTYLNYQYFTAYSKKVFENTQYENHPTSQAMINEMRKSANNYFTGSLQGEQLKSFSEWRKEYNQFPDPLLDRVQAVYYYFYSIGEGGLGLTTYQEVSESQLNIFKRFHKVFELAYSRFHDIQKAVAQAREAQIEVALERVRARTMAMHSSQELSGVASVLFEQMKTLGGDLFAFGIVLCDKYENMVEQWHSIGEEGMMKPFQIPVNLDYIHQYRYDKWKSGEQLFSIEIPEDYIDKHFELMFEIPSFKVSMDDVATKGINITTPVWEIDYGASFSHGYLLISSLKPFEQDYIFPRFAKVFEQTYTRFLDLLKAEAATREARIEASLERIRSKALSMQKSSEVGDMNDLLFDELEKMDIEMVGCGISVVNEETDHCEQWRARQIGTVDSFEAYSYERMNQILSKNVPGIHTPFIRAWKKRDPFFKIEPKGTQRDLYLKSIAELYDYDKSKQKKLLSALPESFIVNYIFYKKGWLSLSTKKQLTEEEISFSRRFVEVFDFAHTRFLDLKHAEEQTREAVRQASLDRIRGQIASMRNAQDLQQITPLIWQELITLEIPFFRCGIFIIDEKKKKVEVYLTNPEGKPLGVLNLATDDNEHTKNSVNSWRKNEVYQVHWSKQQFVEWTIEMMKIGQIKSSESYQDTVEPPESLYLHFIPFTQGMLYIGNDNPLEKEKLILVRSVANAFSFAYARYQDFVILEDAKQKIEQTLIDLKATQSQLIHSEKMASLGELTLALRTKYKIL